MTTSATVTVVPTNVKYHASASATQVREWARENGIEVASAGRLSPELVTAYNAANGLKYTGHFVKAVVVEGKDKRNRRASRKAEVAAVRAALLAQGVPVGKRGRLAYAVAAPALGLTPIEKPKSDGTVTFRGEVKTFAEVRAVLRSEGHDLGVRGPISSALLNA